MLKRAELTAVSECSDVVSKEVCWMQPRFKKVIFILIDALRYDFIAPVRNAKESFYANRFTFIKELLKNQKGAFISAFVCAFFGLSISLLINWDIALCPELFRLFLLERLFQVLIDFFETFFKKCCILLIMPIIYDRAKAKHVFVMFLPPQRIQCYMLALQKMRH